MSAVIELLRRQALSESVGYEEIGAGDFTREIRDLLYRFTQDSEHGWVVCRVFNGTCLEGSYSELVDALNAASNDADSLMRAERE